MSHNAYHLLIQLLTHCLLIVLLIGQRLFSFSLIAYSLSYSLNNAYSPSYSASLLLLTYRLTYLLSYKSSYLYLLTQTFQNI